MGSEFPRRDLQVDAALEEERVGRWTRLRWMLLIGAGFWGGYGVIDPVVVYVLGRSELGTLWGIRTVGLLVLFGAAWFLGRNRGMSLRSILAVELVAVSLIAFITGVQAVLIGGVIGPAGTTIASVLVARGIALADPWRRGAVLTGIPAVAFFSVLGVYGLLDGQPLGVHDWGVFVIHLSMVVTTFGLVVLGGHLSWSLRKELFEARQLGRYRLRRKIGQGGMGEVWAAYHPGLRREVALKIVRLGSDAIARERFEREIRASTRLAHPNSVRVYDFGTTQDGFAYYAMELLTGENLAELLGRRGRLGVAEALPLVWQAALALAEAHAEGIVHRDLKPENLFVVHEGEGPPRIKVLDFGVARLAGPDSTSETVGGVPGTPRYLSPEVASGGQADARSDVYALGCVLYAMLTGGPPFTHATAVEVVRAHIEEEPRPPSSRLARPLPSAAEELVLRCLGKEPAGRPANAGELADELARVMSEIGIERGPSPEASALRLTVTSQGGPTTEDVSLGA